MWSPYKKKSKGLCGYKFKSSGRADEFTWYGNYYENV